MVGTSRCEVRNCIGKARLNRQRNAPFPPLRGYNISGIALKVIASLMGYGVLWLETKAPSFISLVTGTICPRPPPKGAVCFEAPLAISDIR